MNRLNNNYNGDNGHNGNRLNMMSQQRLAQGQQGFGQLQYQNGFGGSFMQRPNVKLFENCIIGLRRNNVDERGKVVKNVGIVSVFRLRVFWDRFAKG